MMTLLAALPLNPQRSSPLLNLPTEILHMITTSCFTTDEIIEDPIANYSRDAKPAVAPLGLALLQTCQRIYNESDRRPLFSQNVFRFTTVDNARAFFKVLNHQHIHDIEIDVRRLHSDHPSLAREWLQYLAWKPEGKTPSLRADAPALKTLRLNFESWPKIPVFKTELWNVLREMVSRVRGLERIVVIGASKGASMSRRVVSFPNIGIREQPFDLMYSLGRQHIMWVLSKSEQAT